MVNRKPVYESLGDWKGFCDALTELNKVMAGRNTDPDHNGFSPEAVWGMNAKDDIFGYMSSLEPDPELKKQVSTLLEGIEDLPPANAVREALEAAFDAINTAIEKIKRKANELGNGAGARYEAFKRLLAPHSGDPAYDYQPYNLPVSDPYKDKYGLVPAVLEVITLGETDGDAKAQAALNELKKLEALVAAGKGIVDLIEYARGTTVFLRKTLDQ